MANQSSATVGAVTKAHDPVPCSICGTHHATNTQTLLRGCLGEATMCADDSSAGSRWERGRSGLAINEMIKLRRGRLKCPHFSFNPKPEAMAGDARGPSIRLPAIACGFGLNKDTPNRRRHATECLREKP
jgi:hypothetical protein